MVIPRSFSSFALSIASKGVKGLTSGYLSCSTLVIAAVKVVLPWSMCPMVPMFTCGLLRSNFSFAMAAPVFLALLRYLALHLGHDLLGDVLRNFFVLPEVHRETAAPLRTGAQLGSVAEHIRQRHHRFDQVRGSANFGTFQAAAARTQIAIDAAHIL